MRVQIRAAVHSALRALSLQLTLELPFSFPFERRPAATQAMHSAYCTVCSFLLGKGKVKSAFEPYDPPGQSLTWFLLHEATRNIFYSPPEWMLVHRRVTPSSKFTGTHLYTWMESKVSYPKTQHICPRPFELMLSSANLRVFQSKQYILTNTILYLPTFSGSKAWDFHPECARISEDDTTMSEVFRRCPKYSEDVLNISRSQYVDVIC